MEKQEPTPQIINTISKGKDTENKGVQPNFDTSKFEGVTTNEIIVHIADIATESNSEITGEQLLLSEIKEIPTLVSPFLQQTGLACLAGSSDTGKSTILRQLAISIVSGESEFLGFPINARHKSVIYVSTEDLERETAFLLRRQTQNFKTEQLANLRFIFSIESLLKELDKRLDRKPADLVIIDCFSDAYGGDLKDTQKIRSFLHPFQEMAGKYDCLFLFLHHTGKRTENLEPSKNNLLSGQGFEAKMRLVIELRADQFNPNHRHFCIVKGNYLPANIKRESYLLSFDENTFLFENLGERVPFEMLVKNPNSDNRKEKYIQALKLKSEALNYDQIAEKLGYASKGSVSKLFATAKSLGWDSEYNSGVSNGNNGNIEETAK